MAKEPLSTPSGSQLACAAPKSFCPFFSSVPNGRIEGYKEWQDSMHSIFEKTGIKLKEEAEQGRAEGVS